MVDEVSQLSLANVLSVAGAADRLVLVGDPRQLAQPSKRTYPEGAERSASMALVEPSRFSRP